MCNGRAVHNNNAPPPVPGCWAAGAGAAGAGGGLGCDGLDGVPGLPVLPLPWPHRGWPSQQQHCSYSGSLLPFPFPFPGLPAAGVATSTTGQWSPAPSTCTLPAGPSATPAPYSTSTTLTATSIDSDSNAGLAGPAAHFTCHIGQRAFRLLSNLDTVDPALLPSHFRRKHAYYRYETTSLPSRKKQARRAYEEQVNDQLCKLIWLNPWIADETREVLGGIVMAWRNSKPEFASRRVRKQMAEAASTGASEANSSSIGARHMDSCSSSAVVQHQHQHPAVASSMHPHSPSSTSSSSIASAEQQVHAGQLARGHQKLQRAVGTGLQHQHQHHQQQQEQQQQQSVLYHQHHHHQQQQQQQQKQGYTSDSSDKTLLGFDSDNSSSPEQVLRTLFPQLPNTKFHQIGSPMDLTKKKNAVPTPLPAIPFSSSSFATTELFPPLSPSLPSYQLNQPSEDPLNKLAEIALTMEKWAFCALPEGKRGAGEWWDRVV